MPPLSCVIRRSVMRMFIALRDAVRARRPAFSNWNERVCDRIIFVMATPMMPRIVSAVMISTREKPRRHGQRHVTVGKDARDVAVLLASHRVRPHVVALPRPDGVGLQEARVGE